MREITRLTSRAFDEMSPSDHRVKLFKELARLEGSHVPERVKREAMLRRRAEGRRDEVGES
jgi:hypothetical protein